MHLLAAGGLAIDEGVRADCSRPRLSIVLYESRWRSRLDFMVFGVNSAALMSKLVRSFNWYFYKFHSHPRVV